MTTLGKVYSSGRDHVEIEKWGSPQELDREPLRTAQLSHQGMRCRCPWAVVGEGSFAPPPNT